MGSWLVFVKSSSVKPGFYIIVADKRIVSRSVFLCCGQAVAGSLDNSCLVRFLYNRQCCNSARRDWVSGIWHATPCFDTKEVHCEIPLHRLCRYDRPHIFPLKFCYQLTRRIEHGFYRTTESLMT